MVNRVLQAKALKRIRMRRAYLKRQLHSYNTVAAAEIRQKRVTVPKEHLEVRFPGVHQASEESVAVEVRRLLEIELERRWQGPMTLQGLQRFNKIKVDDPGYSRIRKEELFLFFAGEHFYYVEMRRGVIRISDEYIGRDRARRAWLNSRIRWATVIQIPRPPD